MVAPFLVKLLPVLKKSLLHDEHPASSFLVVLDFVHVIFAIEWARPHALSPHLQLVSTGATILKGEVSELWLMEEEKKGQAASTSVLLKAIAGALRLRKAVHGDLVMLHALPTGCSATAPCSTTFTLPAISETCAGHHQGRQQHSRECGILVSPDL